MKITIAVPTHNRARMLAQTLDSIRSQVLPPGATAECVVIDNGSTDDTAIVVERCAAAAPFEIRRIPEPLLGSSYARNRAVHEAAGDVVLFIDDDAVAEPDWAAELVAALERRRLDAVCGIVIPQWSAKPPRWLGPRIYPRLAVHDAARLADTPRSQVETVHNYFSANVGFPRATFELFGHFREELGVVGGNPMSGEDTELFERILANGGAIGFCERACVHHMIPAERMRRGYLRRKSFAFGFGSAVNGGPTHNHLDKLARNGLRMLASIVRGDTEGAVYHELECANFLGYWRGRLHLARERRD